MKYSCSRSGTAIEAYGMVPYSLSSNSAPVLSYSIDGRAPSNVSIPASTTSFPLYNWLFIQESASTGSEADESHLLEITVFEANTFYLDYVLVSSPKAFVALDVPSSTTASFTTSTASHSTAVSTPSGSASQREPSGSHVAKIVGPVVAAVVVLVGMAFTFVFLRRRRARAARSSTTNPLMSARPNSHQGACLYAPIPRRLVSANANIRFFSVCDGHDGNSHTDKPHHPLHSLLRLRHLLLRAHTPPRR